MPRCALISSLLILAFFGCEGSERISYGDPQKIEFKEEPVLAPATGRELYGLHCARCHGVEGDGKGTEKLTTPARDFAAGGFSFGNTREALFKTISRGIAGKEMPAFAGVLGEDERWRLIDHLLTLMPAQKKVDAKARVLEPKDRPLIARGALYAAKGERAKITRGLMIGYPIGMSFEYRVDNPRLLRVREGGFVDRADWDGRGGALLVPLGQVVYEASAGKAPTTWRDRQGESLVARFRGTEVDQNRVVIRSTLADGTQIAEWNEVLTTSAGAGFRRCFELREAPQDLILEIETATAGASFRAQAGGWITRSGPQDRGAAYRLSTKAGSELSIVDGALRLRVPAGETRTLRLDVIPGSGLDSERLATLASELGN
jgi:mono/diheme cytochrome c family protein